MVEAHDDQVDRLRKKAAEDMAIILAHNGMKIRISGCGCCGSPIVKFVCDGQTVVDHESFIIDMLEEK